MALVFVSYSHKDDKFVQRLVSDLRTRGVPVWLDQKDIAPGQRWDMAVENALDKASHILYIMSTASTQSNNVRDELDTAIDAGKTIYPVLIEPCTAPLRVRRMQYTDFQHDYDAGLAKLIAILPKNESQADTVELDTRSHRPKPPEVTHHQPASSKPWRVIIGALVVFLLLVALCGVIFEQLPTPNNSKIANLPTATPTLSFPAKVAPVTATPTASAIATGAVTSTSVTNPTNNPPLAATIKPSLIQPTQAAPPTARPSPAPTVTSSQITIQASQPTINVRSGPGTNYTIIGKLNSSQIIQAVGISADGTWYVIYFSGGIGWIASSVVNVSGDSSALPVYNTPPTLTFTPMPTYTLVPTNSPAPVFTAPPTVDMLATAAATCASYASQSVSQLSVSDVKTALDQCSIATKDASGNATAWLELCTLYNGGTSTLSPYVNYSAAISDCSIALKLSSGLESAYIQRSYAYYSTGDYKSAIGDLTTAIKIDPNNGYLYLERGNNYRASSDCKDAGIDYQTAEKFSNTVDAAKQDLSALNC